MITKKRLLKHCEEKKINVPRNASLEFLNAAIVRAALHDHSAPTLDSCYGFWEYENATCMTCDAEEKCFRASIGMDKEEYFKKMDALEGKKVRLVNKMR
jgi:hypothetical protein